MRERALWERMDGEGTRAYEAFIVYRELGPRRSLAQVASKLKKSATIMGRWSGRWNWVERSGAWDNRMAELVREAQEKTEVEDCVLVRTIRRGVLKNIIVAANPNLTIAHAAASTFAEIARVAVAAATGLRDEYGDSVQRVEIDLRDLAERTSEAMAKRRAERAAELEVLSPRASLPEPIDGDSEPDPV